MGWRDGLEEDERNWHPPDTNLKMMNLGQIFSKEGVMWWRPLINMSGAVISFSCIGVFMYLALTSSSSFLVLSLSLLDLPTWEPGRVHGFIRTAGRTSV